DVVGVTLPGGERRAVGSAPQPDGVVVAAAREQGAVGAEGDRLDADAMRLDPPARARRSRPDTDLAIPAPADELAAGGEGQGRDDVAVTAEAADGSPRDRAHRHGLVPARARDRVAF